MQNEMVFMQRALELAKYGLGRVAPNPMVGAVIVFEGKIIGEGYHQNFGEAHAEVNAFASVKDKNKLTEATMYVTLEPCSHQGKTPPCANLIIQNQIKKVVIACLDPNETVNGKGVQILRDNNIEVEVGMLETEAKELNRAFFTFHEKGRPFVLLKWAESSDGFIGKTGERILITKKETQIYVHELRHANQSILVGKNTVITDNPRLTVRAIYGKNPIRIIVDSNCETPNDLHIYNNESQTIILNTVKDEMQDNVRYMRISSMTPKEILDTLYKLEINSVLIEGGAQLIQSFLDVQLWDEAIILVGQKALGSGIKAPKLGQRAVVKQDMFGDTIKQFVCA